MQKKEKIYFWACDISKSSGEGILANSFLKNYMQYNKNVTFINLNNKDKYQKKNFNNSLIFQSFFHKYIYPFIGVVKIWIKFFNGEQTCYINYLPLWNFMLIFLMPTSTIIGPITGTVFRKNKLSKFIEASEIISLKILKYKYDKIYFSHNFYNIKYNLDKKKFLGNFILNDFAFKKKNNVKKYDFIIYYRKNGKLKKSYIFNLIECLTALNYKFVVIGDKIKINKVKNFGYLSRKKAEDLITKSRYAIANPENLYSYFVQDCLSYKVKTFYNFKYKKFNIFDKKIMIPIFYKSFEEDLKIILKYIKKKNQKNL